MVDPERLRRILRKVADDVETLRGYAVADRDVIPRDLAERLATAVGFRNILVHQYRDVDDERVARHLDDLEDLDRFVDLVGQLA